MTHFRLVMILARAVGCSLLLGISGSFARDEQSYQAPTVSELAQGEELFALLFRGEWAEPAPEIASRIGLDWRESTAAITLTDRDGSGRGEYRFSKQAGAGIILQAPHRYHDRHTGRLVKRLFEQGGIASIALNSVSRHTPVLDAPLDRADMARLKDSFHSAHARSFTRRYPQGQLVQLHGFAAEKRNSRVAREAEIILSTGAPWPSPYLLRLQDCFAGQGWKALRYPEQVRELGATSNSIGALLRDLGHRGFTHIELNYAMRERLARDAVLLAAFGACLVESQS